jgi:hypothetical protein
VTTNVGVHLELSTKKSKVIQTFQGSSTRWKLLGDTWPAKSKTPKVIDANTTDLMKKSSVQAYQSDSLTHSTLLSLKSLGESKLGANGRGEGSLECLEALFDRVRS